MYFLNPLFYFLFLLVKSMGVVLKDGGEDSKKKKKKGKEPVEAAAAAATDAKTTFTYYCKGASEVILARCSHYINANGAVEEVKIQSFALSLSLSLSLDILL